MPIPREAKHDLWDLKFLSSASVKEQILVFVIPPWFLGPLIFYSCRFIFKGTFTASR